MKPEERTCLPRAIEDQGPPSQWPEDMLQRNFHCPTYNIQTYRQGCSELASSCETSSHRLCITRPGVPLPLPRPPKEENQQPPQKRLPINLAHHQCAAAGIDPIGSPHPRIQCSGPLQKDPHPEPASGRALTPSRTRFSSPLAMRGKQRRALFQQPSQKERNRDVCPRNGPGLPFTGPSPGPNPPTYPSSLPRALAKLPENIPSRGH